MTQENKSRDFLFELGCEELPASSLVNIAQQLHDNFSRALAQADIAYDHIALYYTPRRIALYVGALAEKQAPREEERQGPSENVAFGKDGLPTLAGLGFMKSCGVSLDDIEVRDTEKGRYVYCTRVLPGEDTFSLLPGMIQAAIKQCGIPKPMRWGDGEVNFIRPVHWVVMLYGDAVCRVDILGQCAGNETYGHRFHAPDRLIIQSPSMYKDQLKQAYVVVDPAERQQMIRTALEGVASNAMQVSIDHALLEEVNLLVEWPVVLLGQFDPGFLVVPKEVLIISMKSHQKCFSVVNRQGEIQPHFAIVSNINSTDPQAVIAGNERVMHARLSDAKFFYAQDIETDFTQKSQALAQVVFQKGLGSLADKTKRLEKLGAILAKAWSMDPTVVKTAAQLSKCDLLTSMVFEFPELQGVMGYYYAIQSGVDPVVAGALREQYYPRFAGDQLPDSDVGQLLALVDRIDTLVGVMGLNTKPTGDKDPFGLRRAALGVIRLCIEGTRALSVKKVLSDAAKCYGPLKNNDVVETVWQFLLGRLKAYYADQGCAASVYAAVAAVAPDDLKDFDQRIKAVQHFLGTEEALSLAAANKRVTNILKKQKVDVSKKPVASVMDAPAEKTLHKALQAQAKAVSRYIKDADYQAALENLSTLRPLVDAFFNDVMVMDKDKKKKDNRFALLSVLNKLFTEVADISHLSV